MPPGQIVAFMTYFTLIQSATLGLAKVFVKVSKGAASARRIQEVLLAPEQQRQTAPLPAGGGFLGMDCVTFSYQGTKPDVEAASFLLRQGGMLGILGPTGSGKSTLTALLLRLYDADRGVVWVGGMDVKAQDRRALQSRFGVVFQSDDLIRGTVYENISFLRNLPRPAVEAAARTAQAWPFISQLPQGLDTPLALGGANLSGGHAVVLLSVLLGTRDYNGAGMDVIARALADRPEILILDNADSALDYSTAAALRQALRRDFPGTTLVIISERVSAVREADCILVLENGRIDAQGCHDALMASCRRYQRMAKLQMGGHVG